MILFRSLVNPVFVNFLKTKIQTTLNNNYCLDDIFTSILHSMKNELTKSVQLVRSRRRESFRLK